MPKVDDSIFFVLQQNAYTPQGQYPAVSYGNANLPQQPATIAVTSYAPVYTTNQYQPPPAARINSMEFRRRPNDPQQNRRPTQQYYQPPLQEYPQ